MEKREDDFYIERVINGSRESFAPLVDRYKERVFNLSVRITGSRELAEEVSQDAFLKAYRALPTFRRKSSFSTWLYRITTNTALSAVRSYGEPTLRIEDFPADAVDFIGTCSSDEEAEREYRKSMLLFALGKLNKFDRAIISLFYFEEREVNEIAEIMDLSKPAVKTRLFRARQKLADFIEKSEKLQTAGYEKR